MNHVWMCQCLCPKRHAILGAAGLADGSGEARKVVEQPLRESLERMLRSGEFNPWCGICKAPADTWRYETARTRYATMEEAQEPLRKSEAANVAAGIVLGEFGGTKKPPS
jgi:hypothetical protein